ncbi:MAG: tRNA (N6-isopentenyl adenosine(37)-C2)-methylthiotransferase MiaB [Deltaproteobacteria bacterium]|nr:tRNA (N6-isopentenyl adenosine(37)-C2)-methylthiotransferase MiaB [Deltaproteobacteria bacterium]
MPNFYLKTYGCQMNVYDSERITGLLGALNFKPTEKIKEADLILFNSCTVREKAKQKLLSDLGRLKAFKEKNKKLIIGIGGCVAQEAGDELLKRIPHLDLVFGVDQVDQLADLLGRIQETKSRLAVTAFDTDPQFSLSYVRKDSSPVSAYVTIIKGCDKFCSFCIVPFTRGREKSRSPREILQEIELRVEKGTREITLLGQNVNSYAAEEFTFPSLLKLVSKVPNLKRLRFTSPHPQDFCEGMIECYVELPNLCKHLHLPVQCGSNRVLKAMRRWYTIEHYKEHVEKLRKRVPDIALSTDMIVGFPGETNEEFEETLKLLRDVRYDFVYSFRYSPRVGTSAYEWKDDVPEEEKDERLQRLQSLQDEISLEKNQELIGKIYEVLVEKISSTGAPVSVLQGRTETHKIVHFKGAPNLIGKFVQVRLTKAMPHSFLGD